MQAVHSTLDCCHNATPGNSRSGSCGGLDAAQLCGIGWHYQRSHILCKHSQSKPCSRQVSNSFLGIFIAWLNLGLGIETFYNGLDAYSKTWFRLLFLLYVWFIIIDIIVVSHCLTTTESL